MHRVIVVGSPRQNGRCAHLAEALFNACIDECPEDGVSIVSAASIVVAPCNGCDGCAEPSDDVMARPEDDDTLAANELVLASDAGHFQCVIEDDMAEVRKHLDAADELIVVAPVYFAGAPAQMKALMDRLQPYYRSNLRHVGKRPMVLHVVGEGKDPHGFEPLIGTVRSAFACAGFELELVLDWVGKIDADGVIFEEADEYPIPPVGGFCGLVFGEEFEFVEDGDLEFFEEDEEAYGYEEDDFGYEAEPAPSSKGGRKKLSLSDAEPAPKSKRAQGDAAARDNAHKAKKGGSGKGGSGKSGSNKGGSSNRKSGKGGSGKGSKRHG